MVFSKLRAHAHELKAQANRLLGYSSTPEDELYKAVQEDRSANQHRLGSILGSSVLNLQDSQKGGHTVLYHACLHLNYPAVCVLLDKGAKPGTGQENKRNAYHWLVEGCKSDTGQVNDKFKVAKDILEELLFRPVGNKPHRDGPQRVVASLPCDEQLLTAAKDETGLTPLCLALALNQGPLARAMLDVGFSLECTCPGHVHAEQLGALVTEDVDRMDAKPEVPQETQLVRPSQDVMTDQDVGTLGRCGGRRYSPTKDANACSSKPTEEPLPWSSNEEECADRIRKGVLDQGFRIFIKVTQETAEAIPYIGAVLVGVCKLADEILGAMDAAHDSNDMVRRLCQRVRNQAVYLRRVRDTLQDRDLCNNMDDEVARQLANDIPSIGRLFVRIDATVRDYVKAFKRSKLLAACVATAYYKTFKEHNDELNDKLNDLGRLASQLERKRSELQRKRSDLEAERRHEELLAKLSKNPRASGSTELGSAESV